MPAENFSENSSLQRETKIRESETYKESIENRQEKVSGLEETVDRLKNQFIGKLLNFRQIKELEQRLQIEKNVLQEQEEEKQRVDELISSYDKILSEEKELIELHGDALEENRKFDEEQQTGRDGANLMKKHKAFLVHDIVDAEWKPSENNQAVDTKELSWSDQYDIVAGLAPTISASSLRMDKSDRTFGKGSWGVFLSEGKVLGGNETDTGSVATGLRSRHIPESERSLDSIERAINTEPSDTYNELVVENPQIAGIYTKWNEDMPPLEEAVSLQNTNERIYDKWWEKMKDAVSKGTPIFVLTSDNHTRMIYDIDTEKRTFRVAGGEITPEDMTDLPDIYKTHLSEDKKRECVMRQINKIGHLLSEEEKQNYQ